MASERSNLVLQLEAEILELREDRRELTRRLEESRSTVIGLETRLDDVRRRSKTPSQSPAPSPAASLSRAASEKQPETETLRADNHALLAQLRSTYDALDHQRLEQERFMAEMAEALSVERGGSDAVAGRDVARLERARSSWLRRVAEDQAGARPQFDLSRLLPQDQ